MSFPRNSYCWWKVLLRRYLKSYTIAGLRFFDCWQAGMVTIAIFFGLLTSSQQIFWQTKGRDRKQCPYLFTKGESKCQNQTRLKMPKRTDGDLN